MRIELSSHSSLPTLAEGWRIKRRMGRRPKARAGHFSPFALTFATALFADCVTEFLGTSEISEIGSFNLHSTDFAAIFAVIMILRGRYTVGDRVILRFAMVVLCSVATLALLRGIVASPHEAFVYFRYRGVVLGCIAYSVLSHSKRDRVSSLTPWMFGFVAVYIGLFALRLVFGARLFLQQDTTAYQSIISLEFRALNSNTALFLGFVLIYVLDNIQRTGRRSVHQLILASVLICTIVLSRERTAGLAALVGVLVLYGSRTGVLRKHPMAVLLVAGVSAIGLIIWSSGSLPDLLALLPERFQASWQKTATLDARLEIWSYALDQQFVNWGWFRQLFGSPAGEPVTIIVHGLVWDFSLHSEYVATIMAYGLVGSVAWVALVLSGISQARRAVPGLCLNRLGISPNVALAWIASALLWGASYEWSNTAGIFVAMALASYDKAVPESNRRMHRRTAIESPIGP